MTIQQLPAARLSSPFTHAEVPLLRVLIGDELRSLRMAHGLSLRELSRQAVVSAGYISEIERGVKEPSSEFLAAICAALGVSLAEVLARVVERLQFVELGIESITVAA
ncbi:MAG: helix-turn-helix domain-containing protein [Propionibacteriaceae bacterium]